MRPRSSVQGVFLSNSVNGEGNWISTKIEKGSWVSLMPGKRGGWSKDASKHGGSSVSSSYKAKVIKFLTTKSTVSSVLVQHAYMWRQLDLDPSIVISQTAACNYLYPSNYQDWVDPKSIIGIIMVMHAEIGELQRGNRTHRELLEDSVFFYNASYFPAQQARQQRFGRLESVLLSAFDSPEWPLPDMATTEAYRAKLRHDFHQSMKPNVGSKNTHLSWFMPIGVLVDLFAVSMNMHRTRTMFVFKQMTDELCASLMDGGWDSKISIGVDIIKTTIHRPSLSFRYHIPRSTLYTNFVYNREIQVSGSTWVAIDQFEHVQLVTINCEMGEYKQEMEVGLSWSFSDIWQEAVLQIAPATESEFDMWIVDHNQATKVNSRYEKHHTTANILPPKKLRLTAKV